MRVDDFVVLGRTVPEESKKYGQKVCMAGYSEELGQFLRVYPLNIHSKTKSRHMFSIELERNNKDSRLESWALKGRCDNAISHVGGPVEDPYIRRIMEKHVSSISKLNDARRSLGVIKPDGFSLQLKSREHISRPGQLKLFDDYSRGAGIKTASQYFHVPYIVTSKGCQKQLQIREWGVYELIRKYENERKPFSENVLQGALNIKKERDAFFLVGNMANIRTVWLIIKVFSLEKQQQLSMAI